jgi:hypothetical protein
MARGTERADSSLVLPPPLPKRVYILVSSDPMGAFYGSARRVVRDARDFKAWSIFSMAKNEHRATRTGPRSFRLETPRGTLFDGGFVDVYRARTFPVLTGHVVELEGATVRVVADDGTAPTAIEVTLDVPLDDPSVAVLTWKDGMLRPVTLSEAPVTLPWSPGPSGLF